MKKMKTKKEDAGDFKIKLGIMYNMFPITMKNYKKAVKDSNLKEYMQDLPEGIIEYEI